MVQDCLMSCVCATVSQAMMRMREEAGDGWVDGWMDERNLL